MCIRDRRYPYLTEVLIEKYGMHCLGCSMSAVETLGEGAMGHGMCKKEIEEMVEDLNKRVEKKEKTKKKI
jgi:hybrid cluster-associated redox disulfide protein